MNGIPNPNSTNVPGLWLKNTNDGSSDREDEMHLGQRRLLQEKQNNSWATVVNYKNGTIAVVDGMLPDASIVCETVSYLKKQLKGK